MPSHGSPSERTYSFISDPSHKETLSGRVTAACLNCRRKKTKCSGGENCQTCRDKGLVCEGPPKRRRPGGSVSSEKSGWRGHTATASSSSTRPSTSLDLPERPFATTRQNSSAASSQGSSAESSRTSPSSVPVARDIGQPQQNEFRLHEAHTWPTTSGQGELRSLQSHDISMMHSPIPSFGDTVYFDDPSSTTLTPGVFSSVEEEEWSFLQEDNISSSYSSQPGTSLSEPSYRPCIPPISRSPAGQVHLAPAQPTEWWSTNSVDPHSTADLISTAVLLEAQARSLRQMASYQDRHNVPRRQTISGFPASSPHINVTTPDGWDSLDEMALLQDDLTQQTDLTAYPNDDLQTSWWIHHESSLSAAGPSNMTSTSSNQTQLPRQTSTQDQQQQQQQQQTQRWPEQ